VKIQEQDVFHGPALAQIAEYGAFKALNRARAKQGHYIVNADRRLLLKYSTKSRGPWKFTFTRLMISPSSAGTLARARRSL
jgi:hypothetical protein